MKETNRDEIWQQIKSEDPFDIWVDPELTQLVDALSKIMDGKRVMVLFREDMPRDDDWHPIPLLPLTMFQVPGTMRKSRILSKWAKIASHLFRPVKTIWLGTDISSQKLRWIDRFMGYDLHHASQWINLSMMNVPELKFPRHLAGFSYQEWKVNIGRLYMELCKEIHLRGGIVLNYMDVENSGSGTILKDKISGNLKGVISQSISEGKTVERAIVRLGLSPWTGFMMRIPYKNDFLELQDRGGNLNASMVMSEESRILADALHDLLGFSVKQFNWETCHLHGERLFNEPPPQKLLGFRLMVAPDTDGSPVEDVMETAYDISKQTGISFQEFRDLFYRYGSAMDVMTEHAYQWMNKTRDHSVIWNEVIEMYRGKFEWNITKTVKP